MPRTILAVAFCLGAISSFAQEAAKGDVAASCSFLHFGASGGNAQGVSFSAAVNATSPSLSKV